jgi:hypothetical protein
MSTTFKQYEGPGIYEVGEYGVNLTDDLQGLVDSLVKLGEDEDDEFDLDFDVGEGGLAYIELMEGDAVENDFENVYLVVPTAAGENIHFQMSETSKLNYYYGTGHSVFGSGNTSIKVKGKINFKQQ